MKRFGFLVLSCLLVWMARPVAAQQWTRFHGPNGQGVSDATTVPTSWTDADYNWKIELPGLGHSSPVLWGNRIFLLSADPEHASRYVLCIDAASGKTLWMREYPSASHHLHRFSSYASCTPAVDAERVYVAWSTPAETTFKAFDHFGEEVWSLNLGPWVSQHGWGTSPILYEDLVIVSNSQQAAQLDPGQVPGKSFMMAFDRVTGEERWRTPRKSVNVCYSVPCIYKPEGGGPDELICTSTGNGVYSLDPKTGQENWSIDVISMRTVSSPVLAGGLIFGTTGSGGGGNYIAAVRPGKSPELVYKKENSRDFKAPYVPTSVAKGDLVFMIYDGGFASCIDAKDGKEHWSHRLGGTFFGSPVRVRDAIYCINDQGEVVVLAAEKEFQELARIPLGEPSRSTPAVSGGRMYLRTYSHLFSIGKNAL